MKRSPMRRTRMKPTAKSQAKARAFQKELMEVTPALAERAGGRCEARVLMDDRFRPVCGSGKGDAHRHHIVERSHGGTNDLNNLLFVCDACHTWIHSHPEKANALGFLKESKWNR